MLIVPTFVGRCRIISNILGGSFHVPFARLSYGGYLCHVIVFAWFESVRMSPFYTAHVTLLFLFLGTIPVVYMASLVLSFLIEVPTLNIEKWILFPPKPPKKQPKKEVSDDPLANEPLARTFVYQSQIGAPEPAKKHLVAETDKLRTSLNEDEIDELKNSRLKN